MKPFTLVSTVFNEAGRIDQTIEDIESQTLLPNEIIITDAGSMDGTYERLLQWKNDSSIQIKVLQKIKCNVAEGRNIAIKEAAYELIASTDFGCRYEKTWLEDLLSPFVDEKIQVVSGSYTIIESETNTLSAKADYLLNNGYNIQLDEYFLPSSRSIAYYRHIWEELGGYPEWLTLAGDDSTFAYLLKKKNIKVHFVEKPNVYWMRHTTFKGFAKENYRYGLGNGESRVIFRNFWMNLIETGLRYSTVFNILFFCVGIIPVLFFIALCFVELYSMRSYKDTFLKWLKIKSPKYNAKVFFAALYMIEVTRFYYLKGYIHGYWFSKPHQKAEAKKLQLILYK